MPDKKLERTEAAEAVRNRRPYTLRVSPPSTRIAAPVT
jgi:hypothetical protein